MTGPGVAEDEIELDGDVRAGRWLAACAHLVDRDLGDRLDPVLVDQCRYVFRVAAGGHRQRLNKIGLVLHGNAPLR
jgi:hypothetical protein